MFWRKKKQMEASAEVSPVSTGIADTAALPVTPSGATSSGAKEKMEEMAKLPGPKPIPELIGNHLIKKMEKSPGWVWRLAAVIRPRAGGEKGFDVRIFSESEAVANNIKVKNYNTLDQYPKLVLFEGWFDKNTKKVELVEKRIIPKVTIYTEKEILQQISSMTEPGSKVFFYLAASPASGGPLGRGAALVELNPKYPGKGEKKYILSAVSVADLEPANKGFRMLASDKPNDIARWIKERHFKT